MHHAASVFEKTRRDYLRQVAKLDLPAIAERLSVQIDGKAVKIPLFGRIFRVSPEEIFDPQGKAAIHAVAVLLCRYLILCPNEIPLEVQWVTYRGFGNAAPFVGGFENNTEKCIAKNFSGRLERLSAAAEKIGGEPASIDLSCDLKMKFVSLPQLPLLLIFNDRDDEFPAQSSILFEQRAEKYLDMECLAILGWVLTDLLNEVDNGAGPTIM